MRVLLVTAYFRPHVGGVERFVEVLADGLAARAHQVVVLCCRTEAAAALDEVAAYRIRRIPAANPLERRLAVPYPLPRPLALTRAVREEVGRTDVVHVQDALHLTSQSAFLAAARRRVPVLLSLHVGLVRQRNAGLDALQRAAVRAARVLVRRATRVVSASPAVASWAEQAWGVPSVDVLPSGITVPPADASRAELGLPADRLVALFVGRDVPKKGLEHVFAAADPGRYLIVAITDSRRLPPPGIELRPVMPPDRLAGMLRAADALVLPSRDEGLPMILQEAALAGLPILATRQPGYELYFGPEDFLPVERDGASIAAGLRRLVEEPALRAALGQRARTVGERSFGAEAFVAAYEQAYRTLIEARVEREVPPTRAPRRPP